VFADASNFVTVLPRS